MRVNHGRRGLVSDVGVGDHAVALVLGGGVAVGGEPFVGGDLLLGLGVVGVPGGEFGLRPRRGRAGTGRVDELPGASVVKLLQIGGAAFVKCLGECGGLGGLGPRVPATGHDRRAAYFLVCFHPMISRRSSHASVTSS